MVVFAVMLTLRGDVRESNPVNRVWAGSACIRLDVYHDRLCHFHECGLAYLTSLWTRGGTATDISFLLFTKFMIPFEAAAVLLTMALVGAVILAKGVKVSK